MWCQTSDRANRDENTARSWRMVLAFAACALLLLSRGAVADGVLAVPMTYQEHSNGRWAASGQSILKYADTWIQQCEMVNRAWGRSDCCGNPGFAWDHPCNEGNYFYDTDGSLTNGTLQEVLAQSGTATDGHDRALTEAQVRSEIDAGRPFLIGFTFENFLDPPYGHAVVGRGIQGDLVHLLDPWPGEGYQTVEYDSVVSSVDATWKEPFELALHLDANSHRSASLSVALTATPSSGSVPLTTRPDRKPGGTAAGRLNYTFWWNCTSTSVSVADTMSICGAIPAPPGWLLV